MTRNYRLTKEQSDEFCKAVKKVLKKIKVSQTRLGTVAGYSKQAMSTILNRREETTCRSQFMSIMTALGFLIINSNTDDVTKDEAFDMLRVVGEYPETF